MNEKELSDVAKSLGSRGGKATLKKFGKDHFKKLRKMGVDKYKQAQKV